MTLRPETKRTRPVIFLDKKPRKVHNQSNIMPRAALGVVIGDELVWSTGVGFADVAARRRPDATTIFRIASITKTFTGTAIMQLRAAGRLGLDDAAVAYLPELERAPEPLRAHFNRNGPAPSLARIGPGQQPTWDGPRRVALRREGHSRVRARWRR